MLNRNSNMNHTLTNPILARKLSEEKYSHEKTKVKLEETNKELELLRNQKMKPYNGSSQRDLDVLTDNDIDVWNKI